MGLFIPQFCSFEKFRIFFRIYTKKEFSIFFCHHSAKFANLFIFKIAFQNHILETKQNGSLDLKTNIQFHTQKGIGKKLVRSWVLFGNWGSVPLPLYGARISETDQSTRSVLISICSLSSSALPQRYPGYGLHSLFSRVLSSASLRLLLLFVLRRRRRVLLLPRVVSFFSPSPSLPQFRCPQKIFSTKARILVLHFRSSSFQIRCLSFHSDGGTTFVYVYISSPSCM